MIISSATVTSTSPILTSRQVAVKEAKLAEDSENTKNTTSKPNETALTEEEQKILRELKARDREVRAHEAAHLAAAGTLAIGGANYTFQRGPDGVQYAVGGEVNIDTSKVPGDPEATLEKAQQIRTAALAPAQPSQQDLTVAAKASQLAIEARAEINRQKQNDDGEDSARVAGLNSDLSGAALAELEQDEQALINTSFVTQYSPTQEENENLIDLAV